jgi:hypothetical protein
MFFHLKDDPSDVESNTSEKHWKSADLINSLKLHSETSAEQTKSTDHSYTFKGGVTPSFAEGLLPPFSSIQLHVPRNNFSWRGWQVWYQHTFKYSKTFSFSGGTNTEQSLEKLKDALSWLWTEHCTHKKIPAVQLDVYYLVLSLDVHFFLPHNIYMYVYIYIYIYLHTS